MCFEMYFCIPLYFALVEKPPAGSWEEQLTKKKKLLRKGQSNHRERSSEFLASFARTDSRRNQLLFSTRFNFLLKVLERDREKAEDGLQRCLERSRSARTKTSSALIEGSKLIFL